MASIAETDLELNRLAGAALREYARRREQAVRQGMASRIAYRQKRWSPSKYMGFRVKSGWLKLRWVANSIREAATSYPRALADASMDGTE
jgi:hypothetical protein